MLGVRDHVALCTAHERDPHAAQVDGVLAVGLLRPPPARVAQDVHDRRKDHAAALRAGLGADRLADALFERLVPGRTTRHADREAGRGSADGAHAARPVDHPDAGDAQARNRRDATGEARGADADAVHLTELLGEGHAGEESTDATLDRRARVAAEARVGALGRERVVGGRAGHAEEAARERTPVRRRVARGAEVGPAERRAPAAGRDAGRRPAPEPREPGGERRVCGAIAPGREGAGRMPVAWREEANAAEERLARAARRLELAGPRRLGQRGGRGVGDGQHRVCVGIMGADEAARDRVRGAGVGAVPAQVERRRGLDRARAAEAAARNPRRGRPAPRNRAVGEAVGARGPRPHRHRARARGEQPRRAREQERPHPAERPLAPPFGGSGGARGAGREQDDEERRRPARRHGATGLPT